MCWGIRLEVSILYAPPNKNLEAHVHKRCIVLYVCLCARKEKKGGGGGGGGSKVLLVIAKNWTLFIHHRCARL